MLTEVKNQLKVSTLSIRYALEREMLNKVTFLSNVIFMILNNACMIIEWIVLYSVNSNIGGYSFKQIILLWAIASSTYGISRFFFSNSFKLSDLILNGKLDSYIVQPKSILISVITNDVKISALGDMIFSIILYFIYGFSIEGFFLFILLSITGAIMITAVSVILHSLSFWLINSSIIANTGVDMILLFSTYPEGIFDGFAKFIMYVIIPVGVINYIPIKIFTTFSLKLLLINIGTCILLTILAYVIFYRGLKRYSSSNLMSARI